MMNLNNVKKFLKHESVFTISAILALTSMIAVSPCHEYLGYINYSVISMLFCLMVTVQGFSQAGVFRYISGKLISRFGSSRALSAILMLICFFMSMLITNDVALLTFIPLTMIIFKDSGKVLMRCCILETAAANLGSMLTPVGNPQNLFLYTHYNYSMLDFLCTMLPLTLISLVLLIISVAFIPSEKIEVSDNEYNFKYTSKTFMYTVILIVCLCTVCRVLDYRICLAFTIAVSLIFDRHILKKPDYVLLATFVCFFIFIGNVSSIESVRNIISSAISGRELLISCAFSQVISNVPCAVMISGFTDKANEILKGVNIGGLGTIIASLASLISYKFYAASKNADKKKYLTEFTVYNFAMLFLLMIFAWVI